MITFIAVGGLFDLGAYVERVPALAAQLSAAIMQPVLDHGWSAVGGSTLVATVDSRLGRLPHRVPRGPGRPGGKLPGDEDPGRRGNGSECPR